MRDKLTHDEIMALPADRLVAEVAVRVMGWQPVNTGWRPTAYGDFCRWNPLKSISDLAMVHKRIREIDKSGLFAFHLGELISNKSGVLHFEFATVPPLDHLRVALLAVAGEGT